MEPNNASAMAGLASLLTHEVEMFSDGMNESVQEKKMIEGHTLALKAKELDPDNPGVYVPMSAYAAFRGDWESSQHADETALSLEPKNPVRYHNLAVSSHILGEHQRAIDLETQAINLDPKRPDEYKFLIMAEANLMLGNTDAAIESYLKSLEISPAQPTNAYAFLAVAYALKGEDAKARAAAAEFRRLKPNATLSTFRKTDVWHPPAKYNEWVESTLVPAWRKVGLPE